MASYFSCLSHKTKDSIHFILYGNFDGDSAHQLINALKTNNNGVLNVFIDTNGLNRVYRFGLSVFEKKVRTLSKKHNNLIFIGKNKGIFLN